jgi:hypothetical protein
MDSLDMVELMMELEKELDVDVSDAEASALLTPGDFWRLLVRKRTGIAPPPGPPPAADPIWREVVRFLAPKLGVPPDDVRWDRPFTTG